MTTHDAVRVYLDATCDFDACTIRPDIGLVVRLGRECPAALRQLVRIHLAQLRWNGELGIVDGEGGE